MSKDYSGYDYGDYDSETLEVAIHPKGVLEVEHGSVYGSDETPPPDYPHIEIKSISSERNYFQKWGDELKRLPFESKVGVSFILPLMMLAPLIKPIAKGVGSLIKKATEKKKDKK